MDSDQMDFPFALEAGKDSEEDSGHGSENKGERGRDENQGCEDKGSRSEDRSFDRDTMVE
jgi:hypothetical protein